MADAFVTLVSIQPSGATEANAKGQSSDTTPGANPKMSQGTFAIKRKGAVKPQTADDAE